MFTNQQSEIWHLWQVKNNSNLEIEIIFNIFKAAGDYYDFIRDTGKLLLININTIQEFEDATDFICKSTYDELVAINKASGSGLKKTVHLMCFQNRYLLELFKSYGIKNIEIVNKINEYKVGWTLGYLMSEINKAF